MLYFQTMRNLLTHAVERTKLDVFCATFSSIVLLISTMWVFVQAVFCGKMWLEDINFPSDADVFWATNV